MIRHKSTAIRDLACIALLLIPLALFASWPNDPRVNVPLSTAVGRQGINEINMTTDGNGGAIVVWDDYRGYDIDIFAQRVDAGGATLWATDGVAICDFGWQQKWPVVVRDNDGGAIIAWFDNRYAEAHFYAQKVNSSGQVQWPDGSPSNDGVLICPATGTPHEIAVVEDGSGGAIFVWHQDNGADTDIRAQRVNSLGQLQWPAGLPSVEGIVVSSAVGDQWGPNITTDGAGGAIIVWNDERDIHPHVYAQRISSGGDPQWKGDGIVICNAPLGQSFPEICPDGAGGAVVAWMDSRSGTSSDIYAQRVDSFGSPLWVNNGVSVCSAADTQADIDIAPTGDGGAVIVWADLRNSASMDDIYAQRLAPSGWRLWTVDGEAVSTDLNQQDLPQVVSMNNGGAIVTWTDYRSGNDRDVFAQVVYPNGRLGIEGGFPVSTATDDQVKPKIAAVGWGGAIIAWEDFRNRGTSSSDIYAQAVLLGYIFSDDFESGDTSAW